MDAGAVLHASLSSSAAVIRDVRLPWGAGSTQRPSVDLEAPDAGIRPLSTDFFRVSFEHGSYR